VTGTRSDWADSFLDPRACMHHEGASLMWTSRGPNPPKWPVVPGSWWFLFLSVNPLVVSSSLTPGADSRWGSTRKTLMGIDYFRCLSCGWVSRSLGFWGGSSSGPKVRWSRSAHQEVPGQRLFGCLTGRGLGFGDFLVWTKCGPNYARRA